MSYATQVSDHVDVTSVRFYHQPMWKACACMCRFVSRIHSRKTVLEFKELLSNPAVLLFTISRGVEEGDESPAKLFIWPQDIVSDAPANRYNMIQCGCIYCIDIVAADKWSLHIVAGFIQAEYFLIFDLHVSSNIHLALPTMCEYDSCPIGHFNCESIG